MVQVSARVLAVACAAAVALSAAPDRVVARADQPPPAKPDCLVSDVPADAKPAPSTIALDTRKAIFVELEQVVARAQREAAAAYPTADGSTVLGPGNVQKDTKLAGKRENMARSLERTYLPDVLRKRALSCGAARGIVREGRDARWPAQAVSR
jgi:hypothetical protein